MRHIGVRTSLFLSFILLLVAIVYIDFGKNFIFLLLINQIAFLTVGIMYDQTKLMAERDHLTNLYNRVFISQKLPKLLKQKNNLSICIVDIDSFKYINDTHGHLMGDDVIKRIAYVLNSETRKTDIVVRWGGDEFIIIAPNLTDEVLVSLNERINDRLKEISGQYKFSISVSMGFATCSKGKDIEAIIQLADENMYSRKREKQNRLNPQFN
ncbi:GGDEF domain-containing protein [Anaerobacillus alkaliphilus]|uniref:GGDEF domain-containing protein n=1 Tax=Anaerobacillus alkaliphilus TaxID=1548597 RepID=A0A4Q0VZX1_9BACI|nr:GGDEF domain-containing protein [Anaerobacillus alkaliphilus]RXJ04121.1 GGDEF domain-containing protein [Anaerobacillus alkaliphilus]